MVQYFESDELLRKRIKKNQGKNTGLVQIRNGVIILWCFFLPELFYYLHMKVGSGVSIRKMSLYQMLEDNDVFICMMLTMFFWLVLLLFFIVIMDRLMAAHLNKFNEVLALHEDGIMNLYIPFNRTWDGQAEEIYIYYHEIKKLEWHECYQMLKVCADVHYKWYSDYENRIISRQGILSGEDGFRYFYAYYHGFGRFMKQVEERSGVVVERITRKEKYKKEVKVNGWKTLRKK